MKYDLEDIHFTRRMLKVVALVLIVLGTSELVLGTVVDGPNPWVASLSILIGVLCFVTAVLISKKVGP